MNELNNLLNQVLNADPAQPQVSNAVIELAKRISEIKAQLEDVKPLHEELDALTVQLHSLVRYSEVVLPDGSYVTIVNNFFEKNTIFRSFGFKVLEPRVESGVERAERLIKAEKKAAKIAKEGKK